MPESCRIQRLSEDVVNRIAAGEVVQRPGAALKEMMENSIDAHATTIAVLLAKGGTKLMQIQDNGDGILKDDLPLLCERYTTSKLRQLEDLNSIQTFGFRGEALASISTVSRVLVVTKREPDVCGWKWMLVDGMTLRARYCNNVIVDNRIEATASTKGTTITVEDLFYNIPMRQRVYNQSSSEETKFILLLMQVFSMHYAYKGVSFSLKEVPNKVLYKSIRSTTLVDSIVNVLGSGIRPTLHELQIEQESDVECPFSGTIVLSAKSPVAIHSTLSFVLFVNDRYIHNSRIKQGIWRVLEQYYYCSDTNSKSRNQSLFCYVALTIDAHLVDVNVHPNKREICFLDEDYVVRRIVEVVDSGIDRIVNTQVIGNVTPSKIPQSSSIEPIVRSSPGPVGPSKKVRVDYSQRTLNFQSTSQSSIQTTPSSLSVPSQENISPSLAYAQTQCSSVDILDLDSPAVQTHHSTGVSTSMTLTQALLSGVYVETPYKESREDLRLGSILHLQEGIEQGNQHCSHETDLLQKSVFISCVKGCSLSLIQYDTKLLLLRTRELLEELFYQTILFHFGCFFPITFTDSICVTELINQVTERKGVSLKKEFDTLKSFACMLDDYFAIQIKEKEGKLYLQSLPLALTEYQPNYAYLPMFLYRLATEIDYSEESRCLEGIAREIARFYSFIPDEKQEVECEEWKSIIQCTLYPNVRKRLLLSDRLWNSGIIQVVTSTDRLYRVFERC